ncbi:hypothetical protein ACJJTC_011089 [Scirpophaga incertulas]
MSENTVPLVVCMENLNGEEVSLRVDPEDDFQTFLSKSKSVLGFDIDLNSITKNQPVNLNDNIYEFLTSSEHDAPGLPIKNIDQIKSDNDNDLIYILDDGTQIKASQIHFDNDDPITDLTNENIPFVKYTDDDYNEAEDVISDEVKKINIVDSPVSRYSSKTSSPKCRFVNSLPFKLVCNNTSIFEAQFTKYLESSITKTYTNLNPNSNNNKTPKDPTRDSYKKQDEKSKDDEFTGYTREDILNMFKDSPLASLPYGSNFTGKRKHARKTDPSKTGSKYWNSKSLNYDEGILIGGFESQNCLICGKFVENNLEKMYLFDNEDQRLHRSSPQKKSSRQLKIICEYCLEEHFKPGRMKGPNQSLSRDEYLVIRNNQQYIFQKINNIDLNVKQNDTCGVTLAVDLTKEKDENDTVEFVNVEIGSDGEIVTKPVDEDARSSDDVIIVKDITKNSFSDVNILETPVTEENIVDNLDDADEEIRIFLGKYEHENTVSAEFKCRFCDKVFGELGEAINHVEEHKHSWEEGVVYPCPICEYGYANSKWLKAHLKAAHSKGGENETSAEGDFKANSLTGSPVAKRTRSLAKKCEGNGEADTPAKAVGEKQSLSEGERNAPSDLIFRTEVKQEVVGSSEDEIWIVQSGDTTNDQLERLLTAAQSTKDADSSPKPIHRCVMCSQIFSSLDYLKSHKCQQRSKKRKTTSKNNSTATSDYKKETKKDSIVKPRRRRNKELSSDPQIVTCHNCNESFTSKVRLKFHMQFHEPTKMMTENGDYACEECNLTFSTETELFDHVHFRHDKLKRWQCHVKGCGKTFHLKATLTKHSRSHTDTRRYVCVTCGKRFLDKQTLDEHGVTHLQIKPFQCHICLKQLTRRSRLRMHLRAHEEELTPKLVLVCSVCSRAFRDQEDAQDHTSKSTECIAMSAKTLKLEREEVIITVTPTDDAVSESMKVVESNISKSLPKEVCSSLAAPLLFSLGDEARAIIRVVEIEKVFRCEYCEDVFYLEDGLNTHRKVHKNVKNPFTCHICKVSFATYSRCTTHKTTHGFYKRPLADAKNQDNKETSAAPTSRGILGYGGFPVVKHFLCEDCGRSYLHWTYLQVHRRLKHINENFSYKCNVCNEIFQNSWSLAYHRKKSHGENGEPSASCRIPKQDYRIPCRDCDEILPNKNALYKHRKKEHSDMSLLTGGAGTDECSVRDKPLSSESGREHSNEGHKHLQAQCRRRSLICPVCGLSFRSSSIRDHHMRTHTGQRPFPCDLCGLAFKRATAMRNHRLIHTEVRAWACTRCPKRFRIRSDLRTHMRLKHPAHLVVIEIQGLNPSPDEVLQHLNANSVAYENVIDITRMSFAKGTSSIIPTCARALAMLGNVTRTPVACSKPVAGSDVFGLARRGQGIMKTFCRPKILQRGDAAHPQQSTPLIFKISTRDQSGGDVQVLLRDDNLRKDHDLLQTQDNNNVESQ